MNPPIGDIPPENPIGLDIGEFLLPDMGFPEPNMEAIGFTGPIWPIQFYNSELYLVLEELHTKIENHL